MPYSIEEHKHRFAAWAAGRAASVRGCRFTVQSGQQILEASGLKHIGSCIENLPKPEQIDIEHCRWRESVINTAQNIKLEFTHGVAAKLINIYLKTIYVCSYNGVNQKICALHPPIDSVLLDALYRENIGGQRIIWRDARTARWSNFNSEQYQNVISAIRLSLPEGACLWKIEEYWQGHQ